MLLKIEVYSKDWTSDQSPQQLYHASLASSSYNDGRLFSIGRKSGDVLLKNDRSISKEHVIFKVASTDGRSNTIQATTPDQEAACKHDGCCVVLENVGKLGTYLAQSVSGDKSNNNASDSDDTGDDDTDDDEAVEASQLLEGDVAASSATRHWMGPKVRMGVIPSAVLEPLSQPNGRVVLQVGKLGSTVVLTRLVLQVVVSGQKPAGFAKFQREHFDRLGFQDAAQFDCANTRLVVTQSRAMSLKQVAAWSLQLPIVNFQFFYDYVTARTSLSDPLFPLDFGQYLPSNNSKDSQQQTFWDTKANPRLLSSCTYLSTKEDDFERLAQAAGAKVRKLYQPKATIDSMIQKAGSILDSTPHCFGLIESSKRKKLDKELEAKAELRMVKSKDLTNAILEQKLPVDLQGRPVGRASPASQVETQNVGAMEGPPSAAAAKESPTTETDKSSKGTIENVEDQTPPADQTHTNDVSQKSSVSKDTEPPKPASPPAADDPASQTQQPIDCDDPGMPTIDEDEESPESTTKSPSGGPAAMDTSVEDPAPSIDITEPAVEDEEDPPSSVPESSQPAKKSRAPAIRKRGWLMAAPKKERSKLKKSPQEILKAMGVEDGDADFLNEQAVTDVCQGLVVAAVLASRQRRQRQHDDGPDYRAFRKNSVPDPLFQPIQLRAVLPRELEHEQEMEQQQSLLAEQRRLADELFHDPVGGGRTNKRRRR